MMNFIYSVAPYILPSHGDHDHGSHSHEEGTEEHANLLQETWNLITDPAHALTEIFYSVGFDLLVIPLTIFVYRKIREPKLRREIHAEIDTEHGIEHDDCSGNTRNSATSNTVF